MQYYRVSWIVMLCILHHCVATGGKRFMYIVISDTLVFSYGCNMFRNNDIELNWIQNVQVSLYAYYVDIPQDMNVNPFKEQSSNTNEQITHLDGSGLFSPPNFKVLHQFHLWPLQQMLQMLNFSLQSAEAIECLLVAARQGWKIHCYLYGAGCEIAGQCHQHFGSARLRSIVLSNF